MIPTADDMANAIVAACKITGEDPVNVIRGVECNARHYALHAILHIFPDMRPSKVSELVGALNPRYYWRSSLWYVVGEGPHGYERAEWWSDESLASVIAAIGKEPIQRAKPRPAKRAEVHPALNPPKQPITPKVMAAPAAPRPAPIAAQSPPPLTPEAEIIRDIVERGVVKSPWDAGRATSAVSLNSKQAARDILREAVENTRKLQDMDKDG